MPDLILLVGHRHRGHVMFEYAVVVALIGLVLFAGTDNPMERLVRAAHDFYGRFSYALAMP
jgi:Flp pilus assembly pilin Flp